MYTISKEEISILETALDADGNSHFINDRPKFLAACAVLQGLLAQPSVEPDANMPDTERCINNLVTALIHSKGWMRSYADAIIRDAIDRVAPPTQQIAAAIHYPECWDVMAYPTLESALSEVYTHFKCSECQPAAFVPITADMVTDEMLYTADVPYQKAVYISKAQFAECVNAWGAKQSANPLQMPPPVDQHPDDAAIDAFAAAMKAKMKKQREKGYSGWNDKEQCSTERLQSLLFSHIGKGDPVDVANFAMMLFNGKERTALPILVMLTTDELIRCTHTDDTTKAIQQAFCAKNGLTLGAKQ